MTNSGSVYLHEAGFLVLNGLICMELNLWKSGQPDSRQQEATYWAHYLQTILQNCFNLHKSRNCPAQAVVNQVDWAPNDQSSTNHATLEGHGALMMAYGHQALRQASLPRLHPPPLQAWTVQGWVNKCVSVYSRYEAGAMLFAIFFFCWAFRIATYVHIKHTCSYWVESEGRKEWICHGALTTSGKVTQTLF